MYSVAFGFWHAGIVPNLLNQIKVVIYVLIVICGADHHYIKSAKYTLLNRDLHKENTRSITLLNGTQNARDV